MAVPTPLSLAMDCYTKEYEDHDANRPLENVLKLKLLAQEIANIHAAASNHTEASHYSRLAADWASIVKARLLNDHPLLRDMAYLAKTTTATSAALYNRLDQRITAHGNFKSDAGQNIGAGLWNLKEAAKTLHQLVQDEANYQRLLLTP